MTIRSGVLNPDIKRRSKALGFDLLAFTLGPLALRMMLGRKPDGAERDAFRRAVRCKYADMPPLLRGFAIFGEFQSLVQRMQFLSWQHGISDLTPDHVFADHLSEGAFPAVPDLIGNFYKVWDRVPISFLHLEKCGGIALVRWLSGHFHPAQIDPDPNRSQPPHLYYSYPGMIGREAARYPLIWGHYDLPALRRLDAQNGSERLVVTVLREPRARIISLYHYWRSVRASLLDPSEGNFTVALAHRLDLLDFLRHDDPFLRDYLENFYVRRLTGLYATGAAADPLGEAPERALALARQGLGRLGFVGITERMDESIARLAALLGVPAPAQATRSNTARDNHADPSGWFRSVSGTPLTPDIEAELDRLTSLDQILYAEALATLTAQVTTRAA